MKKYIFITVIILALVHLSCSGFYTTENQEYTPPKQENQPRLLYPRVAQENEYTGSSKVLIHISETGSPSKVEIIKSSGFSELDNAALDYCRDLTFRPAKRNGEPVISRMAVDVKFDIAASSFQAFNYIEKIKVLYRMARRSDIAQRGILQNEILQKHSEFIRNMRDGLNFNFFVEQVISPELVSEWKNDWDSWPLSFLLYHDFILRFPDYDNITNVNLLLKKSVNDDLRYINNTETYTSSAREEKQKIINRINKFVREQYPGVLLDSIGFNDDSNLNL